MATFSSEFRISALQHLHFLAPDGQLVPQCTQRDTAENLDLAKHYDNYIQNTEDFSTVPTISYAIKKKKKKNLSSFDDMSGAGKVSWFSRKSSEKEKNIKQPALLKNLYSIVTNVSHHTYALYEQYV